ncbi:hypothetical protein SNOG_02640 [Parastagonospora nodorum SN15]|uniref:Uncharacterized protein n=1 Tax=Phaeosphaeria nodorum (strain SN15 / ATCC MYA-4574 / FGSC 10173) TaxID=321614 RepID=Q0V024_PHANO|nr:hypothetical protein SNOG_02640 [Parastagonospora nodorum SN15]EAT89371.1 hypothetical protein SNOG_02640 [Parastagonospora nodorum SN15]
MCMHLKVSPTVNASNGFDKCTGAQTRYRVDASSATTCLGAVIIDLGVRTITGPPGTDYDDGVEQGKSDQCRDPDGPTRSTVQHEPHSEPSNSAKTIDV